MNSVNKLDGIFKDSLNFGRNLVQFSPELNKSAGHLRQQEI